jgi:hypothetical protein
MERLRKVSTKPFHSSSHFALQLFLASAFGDCARGYDMLHGDLARQRALFSCLGYGVFTGSGDFSVGIFLLIVAKLDDGAFA